MLDGSFRYAGQSIDVLQDLQQPRRAILDVRSQKLSEKTVLAILKVTVAHVEAPVNDNGANKRLCVRGGPRPALLHLPPHPK